MARSHPPTLLTLVRRSLGEECLVRPGQGVLVAVSGGGDSAALLHALAGLRTKLDLRLFAHGVDHGLRAEAASELLIARRLAERCEVPFSQSRVRVRSGGNLQARARTARYESLRRTAQRLGADFIATGHHANDRAETVLMRLLRGAGPRGLRVLPARCGDLLRPLIRARKADVLAHLRRHSIAYVDDPSNQDRRFLRVRVRHELLPLLQELSPRMVEHLCALADQIEPSPVPEVLDASGRAVPLGRDQAEQIRRAQRLGRRAVRVRLSDDREVTVDPRTGRIALAPAPRAPQSSSRRRLGAANPRRRG